MRRATNRFMILLVPCLLMIFGLAYIKYSNKVIFTYDVDNYRYVLSSLIQVVGGLAALVISSTFIAVQLMYNQSQRSVKFFPTYIFIGYFLVIVFAIICDVKALFLLKIKVSHDIEVKLTEAVFANLFPFLITLVYFFDLVYATTPLSIGRSLIIAAANCKTDEERNDIILTFEEMICSAVRQNSVGNISKLHDAFYNVILIFTKKDSTAEGSTPENGDIVFYNHDHPLRRTPDVIERIISRKLENDAEKLIPMWGDVFQLLTKQSLFSEQGYANELARTTVSIVKRILDRGHAGIASAFVLKVIEKTTNDDRGDSTKLTIISAISDQLVIYPSESSAKEVFSDMVNSISFCLRLDTIVNNPAYAKTIKHVSSKYKQRFGVKDGNDETELTLNELLKHSDSKSNHQGV